MRADRPGAAGCPDAEVHPTFRGWSPTRDRAGADVVLRSGDTVTRVADVWKGYRRRARTRVDTLADETPHLPIRR